VRRDRLAPILAIVGGAIVLVVALVIASQVGSGSSNKSSSGNIQTDSIEEMLHGIPQKGIELGDPKAKLTLVEFSDPQCPYCGDWARDTLPSLIQDYVRSGELRVEYRGLDFIDKNLGTTDSQHLLRIAQAAGFQNKLWNVVELEFENQGEEGSGWATDALINGILGAVKGLDAEKVLATADTNKVVPMTDAAKQLAQAKIGKSISTPTFLIRRTDSTKVEKTIVGAQPLSTFTEAIDALLKK
jgi:protein-disulfide isomerase